MLTGAVVVYGEASHNSHKDNQKWTVKTLVEIYFYGIVDPGSEPIMAGMTFLQMDSLHQNFQNRVVSS